MKITVLADFEAYPDGVTRRKFKAGEALDIADEVAADYVAKGLAEASAAVKPTDETKPADEAKGGKRGAGV